MYWPYFVDKYVLLFEEMQYERKRKETFACENVTLCHPAALSLCLFLHLCIFTHQNTVQLLVSCCYTNGVLLFFRKEIAVSNEKKLCSFCVLCLKIKKRTIFKLAYQYILWMANCQEKFSLLQFCFVKKPASKKQNSSVCMLRVITDI